MESYAVSIVKFCLINYVDSWIYQTLATEWWRR